MKIYYANNFVHKLEIGDPTTFFYQFIYDENNINDTQITQYFIMHGLGLCIKVNSYVAHIFYECKCSNNTAVPIAINKNRYLLSFNTHTIVFALGAGNSNKK